MSPGSISNEICPVRCWNDRYGFRCQGMVLIDVDACSCCSFDAGDVLIWLLSCSMISIGTACVGTCCRVCYLWIENPKCPAFLYKLVLVPPLVPK
jgi:hypothetical protein